MQTTVNIEANDRLCDLLDRVERGERLTIVRAGRHVAMLVPTERTREEVDSAFADLHAVRDRLRQRGVSTTREEILAARDEGRRQ